MNKIYNLIDSGTHVIVAPCNRCKNKPVYVDHSVEDGGYTIRCPNCGNTMTAYKSPSYVEKLWNDWQDKGVWPDGTV